MPTMATFKSFVTLGGFFLVATIAWQQSRIAGAWLSS